MKHFFKKSLVVVLTICMLLPPFAFIGTLDAYATTSTVDTEDLSSYRKTYISGEGTGYGSKTEASLPFNALTSLSVQTSTPDSLRVYTNTDKKVPVIALTNATDFSLMLSSKDVSVGEDLGGGNKLSSDSYGNTQEGDKTPNVAGVGNEKVFTGKIETGALIVQKSYDGVKWDQSKLEKFNNGFYATNYLESFGGQNKEIYTPSGSELKSGIYISVNIYYEAYTTRYWTEKRYSTAELVAAYAISWIAGLIMSSNNYDIQKSEDIKSNYRESYTFFVIEDSVEAVTFNNLTTTDTSEVVEAVKPSSENAEEYKAQAEQYNNYLNAVIDRLTNTMYDGDMTTSGFYINVTNVSGNQYLKIDVKKNGSAFTLPSLETLQDGTKQKVYKIKQPGKYDITISSYSKQKTLTLYVDTAAADDAYKRYFGEKVLFNGQAYGDAFLDYSPNNAHGNVRAFDAYSEVPVFVGSLTLSLKEQTDKNTLPLYGVITNKSTGKISFVDTKQFTLNDYGEYELLFSTNADYYERAVLGNSDIEMAGDVRVYKFNFKVVGEDRDTTVNEQLLANGVFNDFSVVSPSDYVPLFYGVKRSSANKGEVIVAFADRESALQYAKEVIWGEIETHTDSSGNTYWLVPNPENPLGAKVESYSGWQNAHVVRSLAEKMVEERCFDLTKSASYLTLEKCVEDFAKDGVGVSTLLTNLQLASLEKSIVVWHSSEQRSAATVANVTVGETKVASFVGKKNYAALLKGESGSYSEIVLGARDYRFVKDVLGIDSHTLTAKDAWGNTFALNYDEGLFAQLTSNNCCSGLVLITETNIYNRVTASYYVYFIADGYQPAKLCFSADGRAIHVFQGAAPKVQSFDKLQLEDVSNYVDPFSYIRVTNKNSNTPTSYYSITDAIGLEFTETGSYSVSIIDRFGNILSYDFSIH
ncbi:MAG: hypothetical protein IJV87_04220 [Clostridia bacterium]|nr:hypothetical protein [Clostridia bacterium]